MKHRPETIFEHAVDLALEEFQYSTREELEFSLLRALRQSTNSNDYDVFFTTENIKRVFTFTWGLDWKPIKVAFSNTCDCGAKHTSFPECHSVWCSVLNPQRPERNESKPLKGVEL